MAALGALDRASASDGAWLCLQEVNGPPGAWTLCHSAGAGWLSPRANRLSPLWSQGLIPWPGQKTWLGQVGGQYGLGCWGTDQGSQRGLLQHTGASRSGNVPLDVGRE